MHDKKIIELFEIRSENAIKETKNKYGQMVCSLIFKIVQNWQDTEGCENDVYLCLWKNIPPQKPSNLKAYILKLSRNIALKRYEYLHADKRNINQNVAYEELNAFIDDNHDFTNDFTESELSELINQFVGLLSVKNRRVFILRYWYFMSIQEIMIECNMSKSNVETILFRVRNKLKSFMLEKKYYEE